MFIKQYRSEVDINCKPAEVWRILTRFDQYHLWNPFTPVVITELTEGSRVEMLVKLDQSGGLRKQVEFIRNIDPPSQISWGMKWWFGLLRALRTQTLIETESGTRYVTSDRISGLLTPIVHLLHGKAIQRGFDDVASGLKTIAEENAGKFSTD
jgi:uncharacterized protein YndB with AHSA1/START domain